MKKVMQISIPSCELTPIVTLQVFKYNLMRSQKPLLTLGKPGRPGSDSKHFCKPTDVAVDRTGVFYVSDGYVLLFVIPDRI